MEPEILLKRKPENTVAQPQEHPDILERLEEKVIELLKAFQEVKRERDMLASALGMEKERLMRLEKKLELYSQEREKIKMRIDQLLNRLEGVGG